ncbi:unnamed protein product [Camellia sinensis]
MFFFSRKCNGSSLWISLIASDLGNNFIPEGAVDVLPYVEADLKKIVARVIEKAKEIYLSKVSRLQEQVQAERDLRVALEVGLSMSSRQISSSRADVAIEAESCRTPPSTKSATAASLWKYFQQDFDTTLAFASHERKQRTEESLLGAELRNIKGQVLTSGSSSRQPARKQFLDSSSFSDSKSTEASTSISMDELCAVDSASVPSTSRATEIFHLMVALTLNPSAIQSPRFSSQVNFNSVNSSKILSDKQPKPNAFLLGNAKHLNLHPKDVNPQWKNDDSQDEMKTPVFLDEDGSDKDHETRVLHNCGLLPNTCLPCLASTVPLDEKRRPQSPWVLEGLRA